MLPLTPSPCRFTRSTLLDAPVGTVFAFHANPHNIHVISPPFQRARVLRAEREARVGEEFELEVRLFGVLTMRWLGRWRTVQTPGLLADEALRGPFAEFVHEHRFEPAGEGKTRMTDAVTYRFPGGWAGKVFGETLGRIQFALMFADRHRRTRRWARGLGQPTSSKST